jgi:dolichol-phosphate mannosyltransferase
MDADLQHDERILRQMFAILISDRLDLVVATRNALGGGMGEFSWHRVILSNLGHRLSRWISHTGLSDPMSGFFVLTRDYLEEVVRSTSGIGFKILLDLVASSKRPLRVGEVPYTFRERLYGSSKLDIVVGLEYLQLLLDKKIGNLVPVRFLLFSTVGAIGVLLASVLLYVLVSVFSMDFLKAQAITTFVAMTGNFFLNNNMTYRDRRLKGRRIFTGLAMFYLACSFGAVINLRIAASGKDLGLPWYVAGACGLAVGAVWNYGITSFTTWRKTRLRSARRPIEPPYRLAPHDRET